MNSEMLAFSGLLFCVAGVISALGKNVPVAMMFVSVGMAMVTVSITTAQ